MDYYNTALFMPAVPTEELLVPNEPVTIVLDSSGQIIATAGGVTITAPTVKMALWILEDSVKELSVGHEPMSAAEIIADPRI